MQRNLVVRVKRRRDEEPADNICIIDDPDAATPASKRRTVKHINKSNKLPRKVLFGLLGTLDTADDMLLSEAHSSSAPISKRTRDADLSAPCEASVKVIVTNGRKTITSSSTESLVVLDMTQVPTTDNASPGTTSIGSANAAVAPNHVPLSSPTKRQSTQILDPATRLLDRGIIRAIDMGDFNDIAAALMQGASASHQTMMSNGAHTALMAATMHGNIRMVRRLLMKGVDVWKCNAEGKTALQLLTLPTRRNAQDVLEIQELLRRAEAKSRDYHINSGRDTGDNNGSNSSKSRNINRHSNMQNAKRVGGSGTNRDGFVDIEDTAEFVYDIYNVLQQPVDSALDPQKETVPIPPTSAAATCTPMSSIGVGLERNAETPQSKQQQQKQQQQQQQPGEDQFVSVVKVPGLRFLDNGDVDVEVLMAYDSDWSDLGDDEDPDSNDERFYGNDYPEEEEEEEEEERVQKKQYFEAERSDSISGVDNAEFESQIPVPRESRRGGINRRNRRAGENVSHLAGGMEEEEEEEEEAWDDDGDDDVDARAYQYDDEENGSICSRDGSEPGNSDYDMLADEAGYEYEEEDHGNVAKGKKKNREKTKQQQNKNHIKLNPAHLINKPNASPCVSSRYIPPSSPLSSHHPPPTTTSNTTTSNTTSSVPSAMRSSLLNTSTDIQGGQRSSSQEHEEQKVVEEEYDEEDVEVEGGGIDADIDVPMLMFERQNVVGKILRPQVIFQNGHDPEQQSGSSSSSLYVSNESQTMSSIYTSKTIEYASPHHVHNTQSLQTLWGEEEEFEPQEVRTTTSSSSSSSSSNRAGSSGTLPVDHPSDDAQASRVQQMHERTGMVFAANIREFDCNTGLAKYGGDIDEEEGDMQVAGINSIYLDNRSANIGSRGTAGCLNSRNNGNGMNEYVEDMQAVLVSQQQMQVQATPLAVVAAGTLSSTNKSSYNNDNNNNNNNNNNVTRSNNNTGSQSGTSVYYGYHTPRPPLNAIAYDSELDATSSDGD